MDGMGITLPESNIAPENRPASYAPALHHHRCWLFGHRIGLQDGNHENCSAWTNMVKLTLLVLVEH